MITICAHIVGLESDMYHLPLCHVKIHGKALPWYTKPSSLSVLGLGLVLLGLQNYEKFLSSGVLSQ